MTSMQRLTWPLVLDSEIREAGQTDGVKHMTQWMKTRKMLVLVLLIQVSMHISLIFFLGEVMPTIMNFLIILKERGMDVSIDGDGTTYTSEHFIHYHF